MSKEELIKKTIEHYDRMIEWAGKQDGESPVARLLMHREIGESWSAGDCLFCKVNTDCLDCFIAIKYNPSCEGTSWYQMESAKNWSWWLVHAKAMREEIRNL